MKVICIDGKWEQGDRMLELEIPTPTDGPIEGEFYTVIDEEMQECLYYELSEFPDHIFEAAAFIPISDIDETELVNQREQLETA